jgi:hypothetical protein
MKNHVVSARHVAKVLDGYGVLFIALNMVTEKPEDLDLLK